MEKMDIKSSVTHIETSGGIPVDAVSDIQLEIEKLKLLSQEELCGRRSLAFAPPHLESTADLLLPPASQTRSDAEEKKLLRKVRRPARPPLSRTQVAVLTTAPLPSPLSRLTGRSCRLSSSS